MSNFSVDEKYYDCPIMGDDDNFVERTYFITSDNMCIIAVIDLEENERLCNLSKEDRFNTFCENQNNYSTILISKSNRNQVDWLSKNLLEFLSK